MLREDNVTNWLYKGLLLFQYFILIYLNVRHQVRVRYCQHKIPIPGRLLWTEAEV